jgi:hypothetical protein
MSIFDDSCPLSAADLAVLAVLALQRIRDTPSIPASFGAFSTLADHCDPLSTMSQLASAVRACPLCGSTTIRVIEPDPTQARNGVSFVLWCSCGAIAAITVLKASDQLHEAKPVSQTGLS